MKLEPIDTSTTAGKARVMQLAAEGRGIAYSARVAPYWYPLGYMSSEFPWNWYSCDYGVIVEKSKPVGPEEVWASFNENGGIAAIYTSSPIAYQGIGLAKYRRADLAGRDE
jgi:hypothetical protein